MVEAIRIWFGVSDVDGNVDDVLGLELRNRRNSFLVWLARVTASNTSVGEMLLLLTVVIDGGGGIIWKRGGGGRCGGKTDVAGKTESNEWMILCGVGGVGGVCNVGSGGVSEQGRRGDRKWTTEKTDDNHDCHAHKHTNGLHMNLLVMFCDGR